MKHCYSRLILIVLLCVYARATNADAEVDFNRDIRPILSDTCFKCHGPDAEERHADLRLDSEQGLVAASDLLSAHDPTNSEFLRRIYSSVEDEVMPPTESGRKLTDAQKEKLKSWIEQGAIWENHWSFVPPVAADIPDPKSQSDWIANEIDAFVLSKLEENKLRPNRIADRLTLIRRLSLDLLGLPPSPELIQKYTQTKSARWYEELVEELFRSSHYGEHMARFWLDAARYGDTHGLHLDNYREMWLYRDWVVDAFNENLPYDSFVIEQLAGDLLDSPSDSQLIATGFNRSHVTTGEGGSIAEEIRVRNVVDRVATTGTVFMGLTVGCAQCHDHKYDPISQKEFYSLYAFFNSLDGNPLDGNKKDHAPALKFFDASQKQQLDELKRQSEAKKKEIDSLIASFNYVDAKAESNDNMKAATKPKEHLWIDDSLPKNKKQNGWKKVEKNKHKPFSGDVSFVGENEGFTQMHLENAEVRLRFSDNDTLFAHIFIDPANIPKQVMLQFNDGKWEHRAYWGEDLINFGVNGTPSRLRLGDVPEAGKWVRLEVKARDVGFSGKAAISGIAFSQHGGKVYWDAAGVVTALIQKADPKSYASWKTFERESGAVGLPGNLKSKFLKSDTSIDDQVFDFYLRNVNPDSMVLVAKPVAALSKIEKSILDLNNAAPTTLIWKEKKNPEKAFVLNRGEYDQKGIEVQRTTPKALPAFDEKYSKDRLGLAKWLLADDHPLTSRVAVNRFWQQFFGTGIVATSEDFGAQGAAPTHPELLDWLAVRFRESGWDVKALVKMIVMSSTYRQATHANGQKLAVDPANRLFSRGSRFRLDAEMLRDQALAVSDLLVYNVGGPSVKPPQPSGLWYAVGYSGSNTVRFKKDSGHEKVHRRSLYTFWKRTSPPPQMSTFDAPSRESCLVRRERTNTPLQALLLMNDPQYVEAARYLAQLTLDQNHKTIEEDVRFMYRRAMGKPVDDSTFRILLENAHSNLAEYIKSPDTAKELIKIGEIPANEKYDFIQLASLTMLANLIMNQDEFVTKN